MKLTHATLWKATVAGAVLAAGSMLTPRAAHAVTAALVTITNSTANPGVSLDASRAASQQILLQTPFGETLQTGQSLNMVVLDPKKGAGASAYTVPAVENLIVTGVDLVLYSHLTQPIFLRIAIPGQGEYANETFSQIAAGMQVFNFPQGIVYPAGSLVTVDDTTGNSNAEVTIRGYLTPI